MCLIALMALTSATQAALISGAVNFSSTAGGGILLQDSAGNVTTNLGAATGIKSWTLSEVEEGSGSFDTVADGTAVLFPSPWIVNSSALLWAIAGPEAFTFNLTSCTTVFHSQYFLAIRGTGMLTANGFEATPATWWFTTQGVAAENKFSWSSSIFASPDITPFTPVPDGGTTIILLGGSLLGLHGLRRQFKGRPQFCVNS
jgi:hypothetical protein